MPTWNGRFILRAVEISEEEKRSGCYQVYRHADQADQLTSEDNYFDTAPSLVSMQDYAVVPPRNPRQWQVKLALVQPVWVTMGVFQLKARP